MADIDPLGATVPGPDDPADVPRWLRTLSLTAPPVVEVTSRAHANQVRTDYQAACSDAGITPKALLVWRTDVDILERDTGTGWEHVAGRLHAATLAASRSIDPGTDGPITELHVDSFVHATPGFTIASGGLVVPAPGRYAFEWTGSFDAVSSSLGRVFFSLYRDGAMVARWPAHDENWLSGNRTLDLPTGSERITVRAHHNGAGRIVVAGELDVTYLGNPNWA